MTAASKPHHCNNSRGSESNIDETIIVILVALAKAVAVLVWCSVLFPMISIPVLASVWVGVCFGPVFGLVPAVTSGLALAAWSQLSPPSFQHWVTRRMRIHWRIWWVYRHRWTAICTLHSLTAKLDDRTLFPSLDSVSIGASRDVIVVRILAGQSAADWQNRSAALAEALGAQRVTIRSVRPGTISVTTHHGDPLATPIPLPRPTTDTSVDLSGVRVGVSEAGTWWRLPVLGQHILVAGATGSGKGSVLWSIIAALAPGVRAGSVRLLVVDPKGGMEFGRGQKLFTGFAHDNAENTVPSCGRSRLSCKSVPSACADTPACTSLLSANR
jgi:S-DNA-T family DNA segregation ATPase FtsK/SpoIIIE